MNSSFYNGVSGVKTSQFYMDVIGNNISNVNTNGYKGSSAEVSSLFSSILIGTYNSYSNGVGMGAQSLTTALDMSQGILQDADNTFDLALGSEGWFGVQGADGNTYYTRAGSFSLDANGNLVDGNGNYLLATLGNNITPANLDADTLAQFGQYYNNGTVTSVTPYSITALNNVALGTIGTQGIVNLPNHLYYHPVATTIASYGANLDPTINVDNVTLNLDTTDYPTQTLDTTAKTLSLSGTTANTTAALNPKKGDIVNVVLQDASGNKLSLTAELDENLAWNINSHDVSTYDLSSGFTVTSATLQTEQEVATQKHFSMTIIGPDGDKDTLDMTFTKVVPQTSTETTWNATANIYSFYETYDASKTYDTTQYYVDKTANKVYEIIDTQTGVLTFNADGSLASNTMPTLNNGGTALSLNLGSVGGYDGMVSNANISKSNTSSSNGTLEGFLTGYAVDTNGNIVASFSNGKSSSVAKIAVYHFQNDQGLTAQSSTLFSESANSGKAFFYTDDNGESFLGTKIYSKKLEGSNVSLATALTELIVVQKAFGASAKSITTSDELLKNAINMKA
ncbi:flagellar hook-basal body complex protein [Sulfurospirillum barnesii]|uniref:Flagellar hook-basal body protein n=1 Tax=Sulfurospirillum barnesii (strain ATCC 700032 / DSM 10660 / SES-3) TaxID=760154 RepID=I3Y0V0_SULBS|nr:flagellar hook-basal body complex protein [Sulfurospirillum barnesii]AFL69824.1 flagellar hook-basal body protein [Sulfurospirillum barnesii SES-3]